jgi:hypothetical protein
MKFTIDLENKKILIHDSFSRKDLNQLFSILNIDNLDDFIIDKYIDSTPLTTIDHPFIYPSGTGTGGFWTTTTDTSSISY